MSIPKELDPKRIYCQWCAESMRECHDCKRKAMLAAYRDAAEAIEHSEDPFEYVRYRIAELGDGRCKTCGAK